MAKLTLNLDERSMKNGKAHVRIRISHKGTNCFIGTGVYVEPQYFIGTSLHDPLHRRTPHALELREQISMLVQQIEDWLVTMSKAELSQMTANDIRERAGMCALTRACGADVQPKVNKVVSVDFLRWFGEYGESRITDKTRKSYDYALNVLREYCDSLGLHTLTFLDIDYARLADFARWLTATHRGPSTRHMLESYVRAAYRDAQKRHLVSRENDPYLDYSIKPVPRRTIEVLTPEQMRQLQTAKLPCGLSKARDIALMSFYACGANLLDLYEMPKPKSGEMKFVRHKTQRVSMVDTCIRIEPEMAELIERYGGNNHLLRFKGAYANYDTFQRRVTRQLYGVSNALGFDVTMAKIRRSWASIAGSLDISDRVIDKSMGHVDSSVKDRYYEQYDWSRTARANRAVIDAVMGA